MLALAAVLLAFWQRSVARASARAARENQRLATVRALVASSLNYLQENPEKSLLLAMYAVSVTHPSDGRVLSSAQDVLRFTARATPSLTLTGHTGPVRSIAWSPDGNQLATTSDDGTARVWDATTGQQLHELCRRVGNRNAPFPSMSNDSILAIAWKPDGRQIAAVGDDGFLRVWDSQTWQQVSFASADLPRGRTPAVGWNQSGSRLAVADWEGNVTIWDSEQRRIIKSFSGPHTPIWCLAWSPAPDRLATGYRDREVRVWDRASWQMLLHPLFTQAPVWGVSWNHDGERLATGGQDWHARIFDTKNGRQLLRLDQYDDAVCSVAWGPTGDGKQDRSDLLATGSRTVKVFRIYMSNGSLHGQEKLQLGLHRGAIYAVAWDPEGQRLAAGSTDNNTYIYALDVLGAETAPMLMKAARGRVRSKLTDEECGEYFSGGPCPPIP